MTKKEILKKLENDEDYYGEFGQQYLSNSDISTLLKNPFLIGGTGRFDSELIKVTKGRIFCKGGAEGVILFVDSKKQIGGIIKIKDGWYIPSEKPGLGVIFNEDSPSMHPFDPANIPPPISSDGSVGLRQI